MAAMLVGLVLREFNSFVIEKCSIVLATAHGWRSSVRKHCIEGTFFGTHGINNNLWYIKYMKYQAEKCKGQICEPQGAKLGVTPFPFSSDVVLRSSDVISACSDNRFPFKLLQEWN